MVKNGETQENCPITRVFLESILKRNITDFKMSGGSNPGDNFTSILISLEVNVVGEEKPLHLLFKTFPSHPTRQKLLEDSNLFLKEYQVYKTWISELVNFQKDVVGNDMILKPSVPEMVAGCAMDYENGGANLDADPMLSNYILMVDERKTNSFQMADKTRSLDYPHVKPVLDELAKLHALGHAYKIHKNLKDIRTTFPFMLDPFFGNPKQKAMFDAVMKTNVTLIKDTLREFLANNVDIDTGFNRFRFEEEGKAFDFFSMFLSPTGVDEDEVEKLMRVKPQAYSNKPPLPDQWILAGHGDCWTNNMLFKKEETGKVSQALIVDLQMTRESCITTDLIYFIYSSTDTAFRAKYLDEMLCWYFDRFTGYCKHLKVATFPGFSLDNFMRKFHRSKILGLLFAVMVSPIVLSKPESAVDLDSLEMPDKDGGDISEEQFADMIKNSSARDDEDKKLLRDRFTSLFVEMYEDGVL